MSRLKYILITLLFVGVTSGIQAQNIFTLNTIESQPAQKVKQGAEGKTYFNLHKEVFSHPEFKAGAVFEFTVGEGEPTQFKVSKVKEYLPGTVSIIASRTGEKEKVFTATYAHGRLSGLYHESHDQAVKIGYETVEKQHYVSKNKEHFSEQLACGVHSGNGNLTVGSFSTERNNTARAKSASGGYEYSPAPINASVDDSITIDLMIVYTDAAETWATSSQWGSINGAIVQAISLSQTALDNSDVGIELRLVHYYKTDYDEENDGIETGDRLRRLTQNPDNFIQFCDPENEECDVNEWDGYMEEVHDLRAQYGADVVSLIAKIDDTGGLGWLLNSTQGNPSRAFNVNRVQQIASGYTLIHEIGHNMGNAHSRTQKSAEASVSGGLFHYSAGYQNESAGFHTIMAYDTTSNGVVLSEVPYFSSPNLTYDEKPTGTNNNETPEDNARSLRQIKRTVAGYLPSITDSPVGGISDNEITVNMNREDEETIPLTISNSGQSGLVWDVDFEFPGNTVSKQKAAKSKTAAHIEPKVLENAVRQPANYAQPPVRAKSTAQEQVLYSTSFESNEGFSAGSFTAISAWRALTSSEFMISTSNPNSGSQHYRLEYDGQTDDKGEPLTQWMSTPFFGYQPFGEYEVTINFEVGGTSYANERFDIYIYDGKTGAFSSGVLILNATVYSADINEEGGVSFYSYGSVEVTAGEYHELRIRYNTTEQIIEYYFNGVLIAENNYLGGFSPGEMVVLHNNSQSGTYMNIDDIEIKQLQSPTRWLSVNNNTGVTFEGNSSPVDLSFSTRGIAAGTYETLMTVTSNDPANRVFEVPVTLEVNDVVSNETENHPNKISLEQNYPNPFNPSTTISYALTEAQDVQLEVFNIQGQKVATLLNERRPEGEHQIRFDATQLSSGVYMYRLKTPSQTLTRKMVLIK